MKRMVVFYLPGDERGLLYRMLRDGEDVPSRGDVFVYGDAMYGVECPVTLLDREIDGSAKSSTETLIRLLVALDGDAVMSMARLANMKNIGEPDADKRVGSIVLATSQSLDINALGVVKECDQLTVLSMKLMRQLPKVDVTALLGAMALNGQPDAAHTGRR